jgi:hypothetical protein
MGYSKSLKVHLLHSHLDLFPENNEEASDEQDEYHINATPLSRFLERLCDSRLLLDVVP